MTTLHRLEELEAVAVLASVECCGEEVPITLDPSSAIDICRMGCGTRFRVARLEVERLWPGE